MKRLAFLIIVVISALTLIPVYALERNVWTCSASAEICFETVPLLDSLEKEELIVPTDEETDEVAATVEEDLKDLIGEDIIASPVDEQTDELYFIGEELDKHPTKEQADLIDEENQTDEN